ncbi:MAG: DUF302 domain-containing protein [Planctomycetota bacterium]
MPHDNATPAATPATPAHSNLMSSTTALSINEVADALTAAAKKHGYGVLSVRDLTETLISKGEKPKMQFRVYDVCKPHHACDALGVDPAIVAILPCKIGAYASMDGTGTKIVYVKPSACLHNASGANIDEMAAQVDKDMAEIVAEVAAATGAGK